MGSDAYADTSAFLRRPSPGNSFQPSTPASSTLRAHRGADPVHATSECCNAPAQELKGTRRAHARAVNYFLGWCCTLVEVIHYRCSPAVRSHLDPSAEPGSVCPHSQTTLSGVRQLFDWLVSVRLCLTTRLRQSVGLATAHARAKTSAGQRAGQH
jgi:hypothetical protein